MEDIHNLPHASTSYQLLEAVAFLLSQVIWLECLTEQALDLWTGPVVQSLLQITGLEGSTEEPLHSCR